MSGITTDVILFSQHSAQLVHRYRVFADNMPHQSLCSSFMTKLSGFAHQTSTKTRLMTKHDRDSSAESTPSHLRPTPTPPMPLRPTHCTPDHAPPARKAARATATVTSSAEASADASTLDLGLFHLQFPDSRVPLAPAVGPVSPGLPGRP